MWWKSWHANTKKLIANIYLQCYAIKHTLPCIYYSCTQGHHQRGARGALVLCHFVCSSWFPAVTDLPSPPLQPCTWACKCAHMHRQKVVSTPQHFSALYIAIPMKTLWRHPCHHNTDASASFRHLSAFLHMFWLLSRPQLFRPIIICYCCPKTPVCYVCFYSVFLFTGVFVSCSVFDRSGSLYIMAISIWVFGVKPFLN